MNNNKFRIKMILKKTVLLLSLTLLFFWFSCDTDPGLEPTSSGIHGTVFFENDWPENTDEIIVVASLKFPPTSITDIILSDPLPLNVDSAEYTIYTDPMDFAAIGVVWKEKDQPWDVTNIIGIYFPTENKFSPGTVTIPNKNSIIDSINIYADLSNAKPAVESEIRGTLRVTGDWPQGATSALVVASVPLLPSGLMDITMGIPIEAGFDSTAYSLSLQPGTYRLLGVLVLVEGEQVGINSIRGLYYQNPGDAFPGSVRIASETSVIENIDIDINFNEPVFP